VAVQVSVVELCTMVSTLLEVVWLTLSETEVSMKSRLSEMELVISWASD